MGSVRSELKAALADAKAPKRPIQDFPRDAKGLFIQPDVLTAKLALQVEHNRERMAKKWEYADEFTGDTKTYDPAGDYKCGTCNQAQGSKCEFVTPPSINRDAGSCGKYELICAGDPELRANRMPKEVANYGVAANGEGFGCKRCPFKSATKWADSRNRPYWCGLGASTVERNSCCTLNGAATVSEDDDEY